MFKIIFHNTADHGSPYHRDRTSRGLNSASHIGDKLDILLDAPEGSGTPWSPGWRYVFAPLADVHFARTLHVGSLVGSGRKCELRDVTGEGWSHCSVVRGIEVPEESAMASEGSVGRGTSCIVTSSFDATNVVVVGA